jgi:hypothetical protein
MPGNQLGFESTGRPVFFGVKQLGEARVFLKKCKVFVIARVIAIFGAQLDGHLEILQSGIGFTSEAIERGQRVMNVVGFGSGLARFVEAFAGVVPAADVHHGHTALIVLVGGARILLGNRFHALLGDFDVHARAVGKLFAGTFQNPFQLLLGAREFLLVKEGEGFVVEFKLCLHTGIDQFDAATLGRMGRS